MEKTKIKVVRPNKVKDFDVAVKILTGAGIKLDHTKRTQEWFWDKTYSDKVRDAGAYLDSFKLDDNGQYKTIWYTKASYADKFTQGVA
jgi:hypothetical protein